MPPLSHRCASAPTAGTAEQPTPAEAHHARLAPLTIAPTPGPVADRAQGTAPATSGTAAAGVAAAAGAAAAGAGGDGVLSPASQYQASVAAMLENADPALRAIVMGAQPPGPTATGSPGPAPPPMPGKCTVRHPATSPLYPVHYTAAHTRHIPPVPRALHRRTHPAPAPCVPSPPPPHTHTHPAVHCELHCHVILCAA